jgi:cysteine desulfurase
VKKKIIYADHAATTKLDCDAFEAMKPYLLDFYGNASQPYSFSRLSKKALKESREIIAKCINAKPEEIIFTSGGTESDNWAIKTICYFKEKKQLITSKIEHSAVIHSAKAVEKMGIDVFYLKAMEDGVITPDELSGVISEETGLVSIMLVNNEIGSIQPIQKLVQVAHQYGALFHTDAVQAVGHIHVDVQELGVDMLSASAHKFNGPKGIGFLYIKEGTLINPYIDGGAQEFSLRAGTENIASIVGMAYALKKNCQNIEENKNKIIKLENMLISILNQDNNIEFVRNGGSNILPGNISLSFKGQDGEAILHRLDLRGICVSTGSACNGGNINISHVLKAIQLSEDYAKGTIRISLGKENTEEEISIIANEIKRIINGKTYFD